MSEPTTSGDKLVPYTLNLPLKYIEEIRTVAIEQSSPQKQVKPAEVARSIVADWYENRKKLSHT